MFFTQKCFEPFWVKKEGSLSPAGQASRMFYRIFFELAREPFAADIPADKVLVTDVTPGLTRGPCQKAENTRKRWGL